MEKYVVTITRQFGSLGRPIARELAVRLCINYYDRDIVEAVSRKMNLPVSVISGEEEKAKSSFFSMRFPLGAETIEIQDMIFDVQKSIILDLVEKGSCIIVGRCSDAILQNESNHLSVFIYAPYEARLENCVNNLHMPLDEAKKAIKAVDKARNSYHQNYAGFLPNDYRHKNIMIDSSMLGTSGTAKVLADIVRERFCIK